MYLSATVGVIIKKTQEPRIGTNGMRFLLSFYKAMRMQSMGSQPP